MQHVECVDQSDAATISKDALPVACADQPESVIQQICARELAVLAAVEELHAAPAVITPAWTADAAVTIEQLLI